MARVVANQLLEFITGPLTPSLTEEGSKRLCKPYRVMVS